MAQVSGNKINAVQPSKNLGTVIDNQVSGEKSDAMIGHRNLTDVQNTQVSGENKMTNYMGINAAGMDIFNTKKISENELNVKDNPTAYAAKENVIKAANVEIAKQEQAKKDKAHTVVEGEEPVVDPEITEVNVNVVEGLQEGNPNVAASAVVANLSITGGTEPATFALKEDEVNGVDNASFVIEGTELKVGETPLTQKEYKVCIEATDSKSKKLAKNVLITVIAAAE